MAELLSDFDFVRHEVNLRFVVGQAIVIDVQITDDLGNPTDITGRSYTAKIGEADGTVLLTLTSTIINAAQGIVRFTSGSTSALVSNECIWEVWENGDNFLWSGSVEIVARMLP